MTKLQIETHTNKLLAISSILNWYCHKLEGEKDEDEAGLQAVLMLSNLLYSIAKNFENVAEGVKNADTHNIR